MTKQSEATKVRKELYEQHMGISSGPAIKALEAMNRDLSSAATDPYCIPVMNNYDRVWEHIPPGGFGVVQANRMAKRLKPLTIVTTEETNSD